MSQALNKLRRRKEAKRLLMDAVSHPENVIVVHYSCESFYDRAQGTSPRITSLAVRNLHSAIAISFSIHQIAEKKKVPYTSVEENYDVLEKQMLDEFYDYVRQHQNYKWLHWRMRNSNFGFPALEHRYRVLGGDPPQIHETALIDLPRMLKRIYGADYISHNRLEKLMEKNQITKLDFLTGAEEAKAFEDKQYVKLHQSTLRKADVIAIVASMAAEGSLKTDAKWREQYGFSPSIIGELIKENWVISSIIGIIAFLSAVLGIVSFFR
jgi:hypothetical protein